MTPDPRPSTIRMDMHLHTYRSFDCLSPPARMLEVARERGIDRLIVTDHDRIDGAMELREIDPERIIVGEEVRTREGFDLIGIFLTEAVPSRTPARVACEMIRAQGGVTYIPHPFDLGRSGAGAALDDLADLIDIVEVHNSRCLLERFDSRAAEWARRHEKLVGVGSDAHSPREVGRALLELPTFEHERGSFLAAMREAVPVRRVRSSIGVRALSTYAKLRKRLPGAPGAP